MKILYNNILENATLSATNNDESYPIANVYNRLLELKFKSVTTTSIVTATFATDQSVSCIALGFHNLSAASYVLKNSGGSTLDSGTLEIDYDTNMTYFAERTTVRTIELTLTSLSTLYIGGIGAGTTFYEPYHNVNPRLDFPTDSSFNVLRGGQSTGRKSFVGEKWGATFSDITNANRKLLKEVLAVGTWFPVYADLYDSNHSEQRPIYAILEGNWQFVRDSRAGDYSGTIRATEVR